MKKRIIVVLGISFVALALAIFSFPRINGFKSRVAIKSMGDDKGIFVGESRPQYKESDPTKWSPATRRRVEKYEANIKAIDEAHQFRMQAYKYQKEGQLERAAEAFRRAYETERTAVTGFYLAETYEKLGRYDDAVTVLDNMIKNRETNEYGIQKANDIKARLLKKTHVNRTPSGREG